MFIYLTQTYNSWHLLSEYHVPETVLSILNISSQLIHITTLIIIMSQLGKLRQRENTCLFSWLVCGWAGPWYQALSLPSPSSYPTPSLLASGNPRNWSKLDTGQLWLAASLTDLSIDISANMRAITYQTQLSWDDFICFLLLQLEFLLWK